MSVIAAGLRRTRDAEDDVREDLGGARGAAARAGGGSVAALRRPPPGARGDLGAGVRGPAAGGPQGAPARPHARDRRPQRPDRPARAHRRSTRSRDQLSRKQVEALERNCAEFGVPLYGMRSRRQGIVHVIGPELGISPARHHDRLRRLAHLHARRARRARDADRHLRGRARARDAVPARRSSRARCASPTRASPGFGVTRQGPDPRHDRPDQRRGRDRPRGRVRRARRSRRSRSRAA